jgi:hypothetical protein
MRGRCFLVLCGLGLFASTADAQPRVSPPNRPAVSPYLNLLRPGNSPGVNYYGLVRPQMEFRNNIQNLQQQVAENQSSIMGLNNAVLPTTGHATSFLNTGGYFPGGVGAGGARAGAGGQRPAAPPPTGRR